MLGVRVYDEGVQTRTGEPGRDRPADGAGADAPDAFRYPIPRLAASAGVRKKDPPPQS